MLNGVKPTIKVGGNFSPIPMGVYTCLIVDVNLVRQMNKFRGEEQDMLNYQFAVLNEMDDGEGGSTRDRYLWKRCSCSINDKSWLGKLAKAVYGRDMTDEEKESFDPESLVGKQVDCMVEQKPGQDGGMVFNNIISFAKTKKELKPVEFKPKATVVEKSSSPATSPLDVEREIANIGK